MFERTAMASQMQGDCRILEKRANMRYLRQTVGPRPAAIIDGEYIEKIQEILRWLVFGLSTIAGPRPLPNLPRLVGDLVAETATAPENKQSPTHSATACTCGAEFDGLYWGAYGRSKMARRTRRRNRPTRPWAFWLAPTLGHRLVSSSHRCRMLRPR